MTAGGLGERTTSISGRLAIGIIIPKSQAAVFAHHFISLDATRIPATQRPPKPAATPQSQGILDVDLHGQAG
jgi:hypothetical protein